MLNIDEFFRESNYNNLRIMLSICGVWPFQALSKRRVMYVGFTYLIVAMIIFELVCLFRVWPDFFEVFDCLSMLFYAITSTFKLIYTVYKLPQIKSLLVKIQEHWYSPKVDQETKILTSYLQFVRSFSYIYTGIIVGHSVIFALTPMVTKFFFEKSAGTNTSNQTQDAQPTYQINYMLDLQMRYIPLLIQCSVCEVYFTVLLTAFNVLYLACVQHCCGLFAALTYRLETAIELGDNDDNVVTSFTQNKCYSNIVYSVRRHVEAMQYKLEWYKTPIVTQKLLIMIMMRSKRPITITAEKFIVLSFVTFSAVMRTAFSYLTILQSMQ
ncbi:uncharacterized protein LOC114936908 isoform X2 [Nylanderia fulva]|uniref:uncharacterized protein LOC114936908 isoform X2 n=1 Tax=Nylanderia fulva TaxID=613905 RepID=UPI0010FB569B|nr:uncharacterized protein LOC114936908 isoform X2 [Nylanderia fulva]